MEVFSVEDRCDPILLIFLEGKSDNLQASKENIVNDLYRELVHECKHSPPSARFSKKLRKGLERLPPPMRRDLVSRQVNGCAPLYMTASRGNYEMVEYLIDVCDAPIEQTGVYEVPDPPSCFSGPPLWIAGVNGQLLVIRALLDRGANINAVTDTGSTTVTAACCRSHLDVVKLLVNSNADVNVANYDGCTCLMISVQFAPLVDFLIENDAAVNATDREGRTALHFTAMDHPAEYARILLRDGADPEMRTLLGDDALRAEGLSGSFDYDRVEAARILLRNGADPRIRTLLGDDVMRTAALGGWINIVSVLKSQRNVYTPSELADTYELLGATLFFQERRIAAMEAWRFATGIRHSGDIPKRPPPPRAGIPREWATVEELRGISGNPHDISDQGLAVLYRVLGEEHPELATRLIDRGLDYVDDQLPDRGFTLWTLAVELHVQQLTLLHTDTIKSLCAWTSLALECWMSGDNRLPTAPLRKIAELLVPQLAHCSQLLTIKPHSIPQQELFDKALGCVTHIIYLLIKTADTKQDKDEVRSIISDLVSLNLRAGTGDSLLHLSVSRLNHVVSFLVHSQQHSIFPDVDVCVCLCECGASPDTSNLSGSTPLHVAAITTNYRREIFESLLSFGAHIDRPNRFGDSALSVIWSKPALRAVCLDHTRLTCLSARAVPNKEHVRPTLPKGLRELLEMHMP